MTCKISSVSPEREAPSVHLFPCREASELASNAFYHHSWYIRTLSAVVLLLNFSPVISLWYFCSTTKIFDCVKPLRVASEKLEFFLLIAVVHILLNLSFWHTSALGSSHSIVFLQKILGTEQLTVCQPPSAISIYIDSLYLCLSSTVCMVGIASLSRDSTPSWLHPYRYSTSGMSVHGQHHDQFLKPCSNQLLQTLLPIPITDIYFAAIFFNMVK